MDVKKKSSGDKSESIKQASGGMCDEVSAGSAGLGIFLDCDVVLWQRWVYFSKINQYGCALRTVEFSSFVLMSHPFCLRSDVQEQRTARIEGNRKNWKMTAKSEAIFFYGHIQWMAAVYPIVPQQQCRIQSARLTTQQSCLKLRVRKFCCKIFNK